MAKFLIKTVEGQSRLIHLHLGISRIGRSPDADHQIEHPTVSGFHCELELTETGVTIRDLESTNGTFVDGRQVRTARLCAGQTVRLGQVELVVESTDIRIAVPKFVDPELPAPPVMLTDGSLLCPRHPTARVTHRCSVCKEVMCDSCVHRLRRAGGRTVLLLCPVCSNPVEIIGGETQKIKRKSLLARVGEKVRMKLTRAIYPNHTER
jgi:pSer/pThr/pTyr-binding forkhead associated (FHA) protein